MTASATLCERTGRGEPGKLPELASRLTASADLFDKRGRKPWASVNFLTAHDGFLTGHQDEELGVKDVTWLTPNGDEMTPGHWSDGNARCIGILLDGRAQETGIRRLGTDATLLLVLNAHDDVVKFTLASAPGGREWVCLIDTNQANLDTMPRFSFGHVYEVTARSLLLFMLRPEGGLRSGGDADRSFDHVVDILQRITNGRQLQLRMANNSGRSASTWTSAEQNAMPQPKVSIRSD
jgi:pullulanase/glycogen debranching enzyme